MRAIARVTVGAFGTEALLIKALAETALFNVEAEFGTEGADFAVEIHPGPRSVEIVVSWTNTGALTTRQLGARLPLASTLLDLPFDVIDYEWVG